MIPDASAWGMLTNLKPMTGGARSMIWSGRLDGRAVVMRRSGLSEGKARWIARLQRVAGTKGIRSNVMVPNCSGAFTSRGWTMHPFELGPAGTTIQLRRLLPRLKAMHRATRSWARQKDHVAVHGDLHPGNTIETARGLVLIDWDEARMDHPSVDLAPILRPGGADHLAHEVAACWIAEPLRARKLARKLTSFGYKTRVTLALTRASR